MNFKDRRSRYPGRYTIKPTDGSAPFIADLVRNDNPIDEGTALNAATFNALHRALTARNLLDNSNFRAPINQRGGDAYVGPCYSIDRWKLANLDLYVNDGSIYLTCDSSASARNGFSQILAPEKTPAPGTMVTVAYGYNDNIVLCGSVAIPEAGYAYIGSTSDVGFRILHDSGMVQVSLMIPPGDRRTIHWMAVYEGEFTRDTMPEYRAKDFSAELMECMRYYQICSTKDISPLDLRPTMHAKPVVSELDDGGFAYSAEL